MKEAEEIREDLLRVMVAASQTVSRRRVKRRFPRLTFDRKTLRLLGVEYQGWRGRRVPRDAVTRSLLLTGYVGLVVSNDPFLSSSRVLHQKFPDFKLDKGGAIDFCMDQLKERQLLDAYSIGEVELKDAFPSDVMREYNERRYQDVFTGYDQIHSRGLLQNAPRERMYLCGSCGLHFLATALFGNAPWGPRFTHQLVWQTESWPIMAQTELGAFSLPGDATGHGRAGMWINNYGQLEAVTQRLFQSQVLQEVLQTIAETTGDTPLKIRKELQRARQVLGIHRGRGNQASWMGRTPGKPCKSCRDLNRPREVT